ncbi:MAG: response regulator, partial [Thermoanaerobaculia bacterium]|nr:response regulator [Thermoanaerobaculia bacterium]
IKAQKDAISALVRYVESDDEEYWRRYEQHLAVSLAGGQARDALNEEPPNEERAREQLLLGLNHPDDLGALIQLYEHSSWLPEVQLGIEYWQDADREVRQIDSLAQDIRRQMLDPQRDPQRLATALEQVYSHNANLARLGNEFSTVLGSASRRVRGNLAIGATVLAILLLLAASWVSIRLILRLRRRDEIFRSMIDHGHDLVLIRGLDGRVVYVNPVVERTMGVTPAEALGERVLEWVHPDDQEKAERALEVFLQTRGEADSEGLRVRHGDGSWHVFEVSGRPLTAFAPTGTVVMTCRDVTDRRQLEDRMMEMQRLESLGRLAGGVAHEFNNLLTTILMVAGMVRMRLQEIGWRTDELELVSQAANNAAALTKQLLTFSRRQAISKEDLALPHLLEEVEPILRRLVRPEVELILDAGAVELWVHGNLAQLEQVLVNLVVNAHDALPPEGGTIRVQLEAADSAGDPHWACLRVSDDGGGMDVETQTHIFEPFFTTKGRNEGTGLGLAICNGIVSDHGGRLEVASELGVGTEFRVLLPRVAPPQSLQLVEPQLAASSRRTAVLLVEDEVQVRSLTRRVLENAGFEVFEAVDGRSGLERWKQEAHRIGLVVTDVVMPKLGGAEMVEEIRSENPEIPVLFMSGFHDGAMVGWGEEDGKTAYLDKPFCPSTLIDAIQSLLSMIEGDEVADS